MARTQRVPDEHRREIAEALVAGASAAELARQYGYHRATIYRIAREAGINMVDVRTQQATRARRDYDKARRLQLLNQGFEAAAAILPEIRKPHQLRDWAIAVATLVDKRRLEDGEATERTEVSSVGARERLAERLDELARRRLAREQTGRAAG
ncbi:Tb-291 membrane-associated protein [Thermaerobacter marianensis DSM 12885]|uniref:Tb-291 membrane-associated protein n=1 Tax=Thermaerobacter marianensis (strain ATCC 700841 / DSM 12885 / JCM 10246 / 7p75a) TaxID=644966 RepID=E6SKH3_THEM7|nr:helix-turn-helix domain-containing protein [Thermaerobacter marianensis]ADU50160.1 Tb-291 membrane-associated protein [Thermaerobacter marianensis DSM 12885]